MANRWFSGQRRPGHVDWGRHVRHEAERAEQTLWTLIGLNVAIFVLWQFALGTPFQTLMAQNLMVSAQSVLSLRVWTLFTYGFSHIDAWHLLFNMFGLWVFGRDVMAQVGWQRFIYLYLAGALAAALAHVGLDLWVGTGPALGASGAVMAIAVVYAALFPNRTLMINFLFPVPAALAVAFYILLDLFGLGANDGVAHAAHLGGAAFGLGFWWWYFRR